MSSPARQPSTRRPAPATPGVRARGLVLPLAEPPSGVGYARVLDGFGAGVVRSMFGVLLGITLYALLTPLVAQLVIWFGWLLDGRPHGFALYFREALAFLHPSGLLGTNLGLALLVLVSMGLVRWVHGRPPRWLASVQPGMRWRYLLLCLPIAAVVLNAIMLLGRIGQPWQPQPQAHVWLWLALVLLTSPLQAAAEEYFFRGYLMQAFGAMVPGGTTGWLGSRWVGVVASALVFALFHGVQNPALFVDRFGFGLLAGALVLWTGGLEAGIACHVVNNLFAFGWAAFFGGIAQARGLTSIGWASAASDLLGFALFGALAWWLARRLNLATTTPRTALTTTPAGDPAGFGSHPRIH